MNRIQRGSSAALRSFGLALLVAGGAAQRAGAQSAYVFTMGSDTIGVERFTMLPDLLSGEVRLRGQPRVSYSAQRAAGGRLEVMTIVAYAENSGPDAAPLQRAHLRLVGDSVIAEITAPGSSVTQRLATQPNAFMLLNSSAALFEIALERFPAGRDSVSFPIFLTGGGQTLTARMKRITTDSIGLLLGPQESSLIMQNGRLLRIRTPAQRLVIQRVDGVAAQRLSVGRADYSAPAGAPYRAEQVKITTPAGHALAGTLTLPANPAGRVPAVVTVTGSGPQDRDEYIPLVPGYRLFRQVADTLSRRGIAVLRYDDRGTGESTGNFAAATSADFADDVRAAIAWLRARSDIDPERIVVLGHSEGGLIAPMVAGTDARLAGIVLLAGPSKRGRDIIDFQLRYGVDHDTTIPAAKKDSAFAATKLTFDGAAAGQPWTRWFLAYDPLPAIRQVKVPVLILQGATDRQVTAEQATELNAALQQSGNRNVRVRVFPELNHLFLHDPAGTPANYINLPSGRVGPEVMGEIADWLTARLK